MEQGVMRWSDAASVQGRNQALAKLPGGVTVGAMPFGFCPMVDAGGIASRRYYARGHDY
jgi:hypothetical protein